MEGRFCRGEYEFCVMHVEIEVSVNRYPKGNAEWKSEVILLGDI